MDLDFKKKLLEALRSGKHRQTRGVLHRYQGGYCCLGIVCETLGLKWEGTESITLDSGVVQAWKIKDTTNSRMLPKDVRNKAGLSHDHAEELANMNDNGVSFAKIADWIEENL